jgi:integrase
MKGRPITAEEFERMEAATETVVGPEHAAAWRHLLRGLWVTGLRLGEALDLDWTDDRRLAVELDGEFPFFRIQAEAEKARRFRLLPMPPEAGAFFLETPPEARRGRVFRPINPTDGNRPSLNWASKIISRIGQAARVAVTEPKARANGRQPQPKWASAHDLRRAFGFRLSLRVRAPLLMQLMRHAAITTTLQYYVGHDAQAAAAELWREAPSAPNTSPNTSHDSTPPGDIAAKRNR